MWCFGDWYLKSVNNCTRHWWRKLKLYETVTLKQQPTWTSSSCNSWSAKNGNNSSMADFINAAGVIMMMVRIKNGDEMILAHIYMGMIPIKKQNYFTCDDNHSWMTKQLVYQNVYPESELVLSDAAETVDETCWIRWRFVRILIVDAGPMGHQRCFLGIALQINKIDFMWVTLQNQWSFEKKEASKQFTRQSECWQSLHRLCTPSLPRR